MASYTANQVDDDSNSTKRKVTVFKAAEDDQIEVPQVDIASVVTQVSNSDGDGKPSISSPTSASAQTNIQPLRDESEAGSTSFMDRLKAMVCCFFGSRHSASHRPEEDDQIYYNIQLSDICRWPEPVIGPPDEEDKNKKLLILDLDETLVHSSFRPVPSPDFVIPVEIDGRNIDVYVIKRPFVDEFLKAVGSRFEVVVFTASLGKYADPLLDLLDKNRVIKWRLFREACYPFEGAYVKDLQCMGRDPKTMILVDNSPHSYAFQPENAVPIGTFIDDMEDQELLDCLDTLLAVEFAPDVRPSIAAELRRKDIELFYQ